MRRLRLGLSARCQTFTGEHGDQANRSPFGLRDVRVLGYRAAGRAMIRRTAPIRSG